MDVALSGFPQCRLKPQIVTPSMGKALMEAGKEACCRGMVRRIENAIESFFPIS